MKINSAGDSKEDVKNTKTGCEDTLINIPSLLFLTIYNLPENSPGLDHE